MRPEILFSLFKPVTTLSGIGPRIASLISKLIGDKIVDLYWHLPSGLIDRRYTPKISEIHSGVIATVTVRVLEHRKPPSRRQPYRVICSDDTGTLTLVFFHAHTDYLLKALPLNELRVISGKIDIFNEEVQITHPDHIVPVSQLKEIQTVEPTYALTAGLTGKTLGKAMKNALSGVPDLPEWCDSSLIEKHKWPTWKQALLTAHKPENEAELEPLFSARKRLAYDELLANQLALSIMRNAMRKMPGREVKGDGRFRSKIINELPFKLTQSQETSIKEINHDMSEPYRMLRLLQGDVGSGKTVVALMAMLNAVETGRQAALMAPTEILARQHLATLGPLTEAAGINITLLTGRDKGKKREKILSELKTGETKIAIGTHALFQDDVEFNDLALAIIDEQHRFGVHQRLTLAAKGQAVDVLVMTATPIPRTLMLTAYGDLDVSRLLDKPAGRIPIDTRVTSVEHLDDVINGIQRSVASGAKVYWVCPLIEESEVLDVAAAEDRYKYLMKVFGAKVGMVHGRLKGKDKDAVMAEFSSGTIDILVATTVIEVGVDVPDATIMVIEHAERFGLAQLHQLRGRIGRNDKASTCLLLYGQPLTEVAKDRLNVMRNSNDGFFIAEEDLRLRGAGEILGTRQSGLPEFKIANLSDHSELLAIARNDAELLLNHDPDLNSRRGVAARTLLYLFERDEGIRYLRSG